MNKIRILNAEPQDYSPDAKELLATLGELVEQPLSQNQLLAEIERFNILIVRLGFKIDSRVLNAATRLRVIVTPTTGLDHIDLEAAQKKGVAVLSLRGETSFLESIPATAEHTWALLLALLRKIPAAFQSVREGQWDRMSFRGHDLCGQRLGLVGVGRIGRKVAQYGMAFGMHVGGYDPFTDVQIGGVEYFRTLPDLLACSDILSVHVPLNEHTQHMIGKQELLQLPYGSYLINTSRGRVIDETALLDVLQRGHLAAAALDVVEDELEERKQVSSELLAYAREHDNLLITPHIGGATYESMHKTEVFMARKLQAFLSASPLTIEGS